jgi:hypothetical protein
MGLSGLMSGEGKPPAAVRSRSSALPRLYGTRLQTRIIGANGGFTQVGTSPLLAPADATGRWRFVGIDEIRSEAALRDPALIRYAKSMLYGVTGADPYTWARISSVIPGSFSHCSR